ncbi:MAG: hypothetical protein B7Y16_04560 [Methylotenera sp. 24-45-7]|jgi:hypothetical protein|nr:MAG: hypothetical protein B7Y16_04560 [Methylotenera sp. 24-45-7]OZA53732.1 MAG: hypothetical protein B7X73_03320 [Methylophilales bacterium 39-45-7]HQS37581.1 hypothetical protein [Methylotenera sp.]HQS44103.1 hypothetical protein [Methylotenera sp.]
MDIFNSPWLINMLAKSSTTPHGRLLSLFDILDDWLLAPNVQKSTEFQHNPSPILVSYCTEQAKSLGAENPIILAEHIVLIAHSAALQAIEHPGSNSLMHAKKAASALIQAQTQKADFYTKLKQQRPMRYGIAASILVIIGAGAIWLPTLLQTAIPGSYIAQHNAPIKVTANAIAQSKALTAIDASKMYAKYEQMRSGTCQFPEALQIPDKHKSVYLENVVGGKLPADLDDLAIANFYLEKVRCNFTPMLMATSK